MTYAEILIEEIKRGHITFHAAADRLQELSCMSRRKAEELLKPARIVEVK